MRKYGLFHPPVLSFFSKDLYIDVARNWTGTGIIYLLMLLIITWGLITVRAHFATTALLNSEGRAIAAKIPTMKLTKGKIAFEVEQPFIVNEPESDKPLIILDTTGQTTSLDDHPGVVMLVTETKMITRNQGKVEEVDLSQLPDFKVDQQTLQGWLESAGTIIVIVLLPIFLVTSIVYRLLQLILYALIAGAFASSAKLKLDFSTQMRLAAMALTPAIVLDTILWVGNIEMPFWWPICFFLTLGYLYFGIGAVAKAQPPDQQPTEVRPSDAGVNEPTALAPAPRL